jgi:hypothetical protein
VLSQREKFVFSLLSIYNALGEQEVSEDFHAALLEVLRGRYDELSVIEGNELVKEIREEIKAANTTEIVKDIMKKLG